MCCCTACVGVAVFPPVDCDSPASVIDCDANTTRCAANAHTPYHLNSVASSCPVCVIMTVVENS